MTDCVFFKNTKIRNVAFIDLEMYNKDEISEIGIVIFDLHEKIVRETFCTLVSREDYTKELNM